MTSAAAITWDPDVLGEDFRQHTIDLGVDPQGEGQIVATVVKHVGPLTGTERGAVLYLHGFSDYFFQVALAEFFAERGYRFYAIDLRKCGRSLRPGHSPHYIEDLASYDDELGQALAIVRGEIGDELPVVFGAHSTGGLIGPLWISRLHAAGAGRIDGAFLNSPWFDLQGSAMLRVVGTPIIKGIGAVRGKTALPVPKLTEYGDGLHVSRRGEWDYDLDWKPLTGFPILTGFLRAVRNGHAEFQAGLDIGCPSLVLRSRVSRGMKAAGDKADTADIVLDTRQIARWSGCLGNRQSTVPIDGARHDVFLSLPAVREVAYAELDRWLSEFASMRGDYVSQPN